MSSLSCTKARKLRKALGYETAAFIRTDKQLVKIANYKPFRGAGKDAAELNILFLADTLDPKSRQKLLNLGTETDRFQVHGREIYWLRKKKPGKSTFATVSIDTVLKKPFTIRSAKASEGWLRNIHSSGLDASSHKRLSSYRGDAARRYPACALQWIFRIVSKMG
ncbi:MAG TPA: DUF1697 domain-containing protein [Anaerolineales bacterium]|nr:DUF1697 domain-containing protein [Anaerolineales bacterium]